MKITTRSGVSCAAGLAKSSHRAMDVTGRTSTDGATPKTPEASNPLRASASDTITA